MEPYKLLEQKIIQTLYEKWRAHGFPVSISIDEVEKLCDINIKPNNISIALQKLESTFRIKLLDSRTYIATSRLLADAGKSNPEFTDDNKLRIAILKYSQDIYLTNTDAYIESETLEKEFNDIQKNVLYREVQYLDMNGMLKADFLSGGFYVFKMSSRGNTLLLDKAYIDTHFPTSSTALPQKSIVSQDIFKDQLMQFYDLVVITHKWNSVWEEFNLGQAGLDKKDWVTAIREFYNALESAIQYKLSDKAITYGENDTLKTLSGYLVDNNIIPINYKQMFDFLTTIRNPKSHGKGKQILDVELGYREAYLMRNHVISLIIYLTDIP